MRRGMGCDVTTRCVTAPDDDHTVTLPEWREGQFGRSTLLLSLHPNSGGGGGIRVQLFSA